MNLLLGNIIVDSTVIQNEAMKYGLSGAGIEKGKSTDRLKNHKKENHGKKGYRRCQGDNDEDGGFT